MILILDTETTGLKDPHLCQVAYQKLGEKDIQSAMFKPPREIETEAMAVSHITNKMVEKMPPFEGSDTQFELSELLKTHVLVAHNAPFDIAVLKNGGVETKWYIDTRKVALSVIDCDRYSMQFLRYHLGMEIDAVAHDAVGDVKILHALFLHLGKLVGEKIKDSNKSAIWTEMVRITKTPILLRKVGFGKYSIRGKEAKPDGTHYTWEELSKVDPSYLQWLLDQESSKPVEEQNSDLIYTMTTYLK